MRLFDKINYSVGAACITAEVCLSVHQWWIVVGHLGFCLGLVLGNISGREDAR